MAFCGKIAIIDRDLLTHSAFVSICLHIVLPQYVT